MRIVMGHVNVPSVCQNFVSFPIQTVLVVKLGFKTHIFKSEEDLTSFEFMALS